MPTLMQRGADWLGERLKTAAGRSVVIRRRGTIIGSVTAWVSFQQYQLVDESGIVTTSPVWDWTVKADEVPDLRDGDVISESLNGATIQYEVLPIGDMNAVTPLDAGGELVLIHTKRIAG